MGDTCPYALPRSALPTSPIWHDRFYLKNVSNVYYKGVRQRFDWNPNTVLSDLEAIDFIQLEKDSEASSIAVRMEPSDLV